MRRLLVPLVVIAASPLVAVPPAALARSSGGEVRPCVKQRGGATRMPQRPRQRCTKAKRLVRLR
jgi:hypothetical protein